MSTQSSAVLIENSLTIEQSIMRPIKQLFTQSDLNFNKVYYSHHHSELVKCFLCVHFAMPHRYTFVLLCRKHGRVQEHLI